MIRFDHVTKRYPDGTVAVDDLSLEAASGKITVFVGPSGCGKTTSLRMINRMIEPTSGTIWLRRPRHRERRRGRPAPRHRLRHPARRSVPAPDHRRQRRHRADAARRHRSQARSRAMELLERVGLDASFAKRYPAQLSGGQQQRVGVARALAADPPVMLMDEPFSAVDPVVRAQLQEEFLRLQQRARQDDRLRHPRHRRGGQARRPGRGAARPAGTSPSWPTPAELLAQPADDFVAGFVGRDRGYRALGFEAAGDLDPRGADRALGADGATAGPAALDSWVLVVDDRRRAAWAG